MKEQIVEELRAFFKLCCVPESSYGEVLDAYLQGEKAMMQLIADIKEQMK